MIKKILFTLTFVLTCAAIMAVPAKRGQWKTITLADGSQVRAELRGDEHMRAWFTADGRCYQLIDNVYKETDVKTLKAKAKARRASSSMRRVQKREFGVPGRFTGDKRCLVILVNFTDQTFKASNDSVFFDRMTNETGFSDGKFVGSMKDYFHAQSGGQFNLSFDVMGPVTVSKNYSYYGKNNAVDDDQYPDVMVKEAVLLVNEKYPKINFADYDWDHDGKVDQVYVIYAGKGEHDNDSQKDLIWPHSWDLSDTANGACGMVEVDGVNVDTYACGPELNADGTASGIGTMCHEFTHCLGLPDFYDVNGDDDNFGMATWSLMDYGSYNGDGYVPCNYTSYEKWFCGWLEPIELTEPTEVTGMKSMTDYGDAYIIYNPANRNEFFLLENHTQTGWDAEAYGSGMLVIHVDYDKEVWKNNEVNTVKGHQRCTIVPADNNPFFSYSSLIHDPYPYKQNDSISNTSEPAFILYNNNEDGTKFLNRKVTDIKIASDGTVSFKFDTDNNQGALPSGDYLFYESFDQCDGTGGNDNQWSGSIASSAFNPDNEGWSTVTDAQYGGNQCARFGSSKKDGTTTSPSFTLNGTTTLTFKAAPWGNEDCSLVLSVNETILGSIDLANNQWTEYTIEITGYGHTTLKFQPTTKRFFLDEVKVANPTTTAIRELKLPQRREPEGIYTLDGRYLGSDRTALSRGIYIVNGKKMVIK